MQQTKAEKVEKFKGMMVKYQGAIGEVAGKHMTAERVTKLAAMAFSRNPLLADCTPLSLLTWVLYAAQTGLTCGGARPQLHAVPFRNRKTGKMEAIPVIDYRGMMALARRRYEGLMFEARHVYERDHFVLSYGTTPGIDHRPVKTDDRGDRIGCYAVATDDKGRKLFEYMTAGELEKVRLSSKAKDAGPWKEWKERMELKSVLKRLCNLMDDGSEEMAAVASDELGPESVHIPVALPMEDLEEKPSTELAGRIQERQRKAGRKPGKGGKRAATPAPVQEPPAEQPEAPGEDDLPAAEPEIPDHVQPTEPEPLRLRDYPEDPPGREPGEE
jgi:recombination protein RecT